MKVATVPDMPIPAAHSHVFLAEGHEQAEHRTWWVIAFCGCMMVAEIVGGLLFGSHCPGRGRAAHEHPCRRGAPGGARLQFRS